MTPQVALDLSQDGITLLSRAPDGAWWREGAVRLDDPAFGDALGRLRDRAERRHGPDFTSILILPESQLLLTVLERDDRPPQATIRALLAGRTPYPVEDLAFDYVERGDRLHVAVVALETLLEAETFALDHGLRPVGFAAAPRDAAFPAIARLGQTGAAETFLDGDVLELDLPRDAMRIVPAPPLPEPEPEPKIQHEPAPDATATPESRTATEPEPVAAEPSETLDDAVGEPGPSPEAAGVEEIDPPTEVISAPAPIVATSEPEAASPPEDEAPPTDSVPVERSPADAAPAAVARSDAEADDTPSRSDTPDDEDRTVDALPHAAPAPMRTVPPPLVASKSEPDADGIAFSTRRAKRGGPPTVAGTGTLGRLRPRLGALTGGTDAPRAEPKMGGTTRPPTQAPAPGLAAPARSAAAAPAAVSADPPATAGRAKLVAQIARARAAGPDIRAKGTEPALSKSAPATEAEALALPGYAREKARGGPEAVARPKLGLWLTLGLLVALLLVAIWSVLFLPSTQLANLWRDDPEAVEVARAPVEAPAPVVPAEAAPEVAAVATPAPSAPATTVALLPEATAAPTTDAAVIAPPEPLALPDVPATDPQIELAAIDPAAARPTPEARSDAEVAPAQETPTAEAGPAAATQPEGPTAPAVGDLDTLYLAAIDPSVPQGDAVALPRPSAADAPPRATEPVDPAAQAAATAAPRPEPTPEGTVVEGFTLRAGRPAILPAPRPGDPALPAETETVDATGTDPGTGAPALDAEAEAARAELRRVRPAPRPDDAVERIERAQNGGLLRSELAALRPQPRPESAQTIAAAVQAAAAASAQQSERAEAAAAARAAAEADAADEEVAAAAARAAAAAAIRPVSPLAIPGSERPDSRPRSVERAAARIVERRQESRDAATRTETAPARQQATQADRGRQQTRAAPTSVARAATEQNVLRLNQINLIGVYGRPSARRALVRLANGRYVKVEVGDRLDRGRVVAIGTRELQYQRGGRNVVLRMPRV